MRLIIYILLLANFIFYNTKAHILSNHREKSTIEYQIEKKYYCPMHPEIVSENEGKCPKCGMALAKIDDIPQSPIVALLDNPTHVNNVKDLRVQVWVLTSKERKSLVNHFRETATDSIIKNRLSDSAFMNMMLKGTHHIIVRITDKDGKESGEVVQVQVNPPSKNKVTNILNAMLGYFEGSMSLNEKGKHKFTVYILNNGKTVDTDFNYNVY